MYIGVFSFPRNLCRASPEKNDETRILTINSIRYLRFNHQNSVYIVTEIQIRLQNDPNVRF